MRPFNHSFCCGFSARWLIGAALSLVLAACGGGGGTSAGASGGGTTDYSVGGTVSGLNASGLVLTDNGGDSLTVTSGSTTFTFSSPLAGGASYDVAVATQPTGESCSVSSGTGVIAGNVVSVKVACTVETFTISGTISGLSADGLKLQFYAAGPLLSIAAGASKFTYSNVPYGTHVALTVAAQPYWQWCTPGASNFSGAITSNITTDTLNCVRAGAHVTTLAGSLATGSANGTGSAASFNGPAGIALDPTGDLDVADVYNDEIRKVTPAGVVTTFAGSTTPGDSNGTGTSASFYDPVGVTVDSAGDAYVADTENNEIRKITPAGVVSTFAGSLTAGHADGTGAAASFYTPYGVAVDVAGNVYVADSGNNEIRMITSTGIVSTLAGSTTPGNADGTGSAASFNRPIGVAVDSGGDVYVADVSNNEIRKITPTGVVTTLAGSGAPGSANGTGSAALFYDPSGVAVDKYGNVYVADTNNNEIRMITPAGVVTTLAGSTTPGSADGIGTAASFKAPFDVTVDTSGNLYVTDYGNNEIREISPGAP